MAAKGAAGGFVVTSGTFSEEAIAFANGRNVQLVDGPKLFGLIQQARAARGGQIRSEAPRRPVAASQAAVPEKQDVLTCPSCSSAMVRRVAKRGDNAGKAFWGCTEFPSCRGTRPWDHSATQMSSVNRHGC